MTIASELPPDLSNPDEFGLDRSTLTRLLFDRRALATTQADRDRLSTRVIEVNMCVAESIAHRYHGRGERIDDLQQVAYLGLSKAVAGFDPTRGKDFLTYAVPTITGELKKHFRDHCWAVRPPRRIQELQGRMAGCHESLGQTLTRPPRPSDLAAKLGVPVGDVIEALAADGCFTPSSLDVPVGESGSSCLGELIGGHDPGFDRSESRAILGPVVRRLPDRDRETLALRFYLQWTQEQIANHLGITQMQVSRILSRILRDLRAEIG